MLHRLTLKDHIAKAKEVLRVASLDSKNLHTSKLTVKQSQWQAKTTDLYQSVSYGTYFSKPLFWILNLLLGGSRKGGQNTKWLKYKKTFADKSYQYLLFMYKFEPRWLLSFLFGCLAGLALPPVYFIIALPVVFASVLRLIDFTSGVSKVYLLVGLPFCFGYNLVSLYWISFSLLTDPKLIVFVPFVAVGIPLVYAAFSAVGFAIYSVVSGGLNAINRSVLFACMWCAFEYVKGYLILPLPWNFIGYSAGISDGLMQASSILGVFGTGLLIMIFSSSCQMLFLNGDVVYFASYLRFIATMFIILLCVWVGGEIRLANQPKGEIDDRVRLLIVQGNVKHSNDWTPEYKEELFRSYEALTNKYNNEVITHIIWPEGAMPYVLQDNREIVERVRNMLHDKEIIMMGGVRIYDDNININNTKIYNSMLMMDRKARKYYYDKSMLVPFGEYIPMKRFLPFINKITNGAQDFSRGEGFEVTDILNTPPFVPLICFEVAFSGKIPLYKESDFSVEPGFMINITNDSWFGYSSGPFQHFLMARFRAIEQGMPLVRAASTGKSAIIDPLGRVVQYIKLFKQGVIVDYLPAKTKDGTIFSVVRNWPSVIFILIVFGGRVFGVFYHIYLDPIRKVIFNYLKRA